MKQPHTEQAVKHTDDQQNTGNHHTQPAPDQLGGTRAGAENVERVNRDAREESVETGTDIDKVSGLDEANTSTKQVSGPERHPERDEFGRL